MAATFLKTILRAGQTYASPDGSVNVTPQRLKHWQRQHEKLTRARQVVPMHWDHGSDLESLQPITMSDFESPRTRSARNTIGRMVDFKVNPDGQSAEVSFRVSSEQAAKAFESNDVYVSPVIFPKWKDGAGNEYVDLITHLDAVNHPVDHSQSEARLVRRGSPEAQTNTQYVACALRLSTSAKPLRLSMKGDSMDMEKDTEEMDFESNTEGDGSPEMNSEEAKSPPPTPAESPSVPVAQLMAALADIGVMLPEGTDEKSFYDRLLTSAIAKKAAEAESEPMADPMLDEDTFDQTGDTMVIDPQIATMSSSERYADKMFREKLTSRLNSLLETGRCTPYEHSQQVEAISLVRLSLNSDGDPRETRSSFWMESRESVPAGTFWSKEEKLKRLSSDPVEHPKDKVFGGDPGNPTEEEAEKIAASLVS